MSLVLKGNSHDSKFHVNDPFLLTFLSVLVLFAFFTVVSGFAHSELEGLLFSIGGEYKRASPLPTFHLCGVYPYSILLFHYDLI